MSDYVIRRVSRICEDVGNVEELHLRNGIEYLNLHGNKLLNTLGFTNTVCHHEELPHAGIEQWL